MKTKEQQRLYMRQFRAQNDDYQIRTIFYGMRHRCYDSNSCRYSRYGGRGIVICDEWLSSPDEFVEWAKANGWKRGLQIDRINCDGPYSPLNCRFTTNAENNRNRRNNKLTHEQVGEIRRRLAEGSTGVELAREYKVTHQNIYDIKNLKLWHPATFANSL